MAKHRPEDLAYFRSCPSVVELADALFRPARRTKDEAARALAELASDEAALRDRVRALPGGAVAALWVLTGADRPLAEEEMNGACDALLGAGRGARAFRALLGSPFVATDRAGYGGYGAYGGYRFTGWKAFLPPLRRILGPLHQISPPAGEGPSLPDQGSFALAILLGHLCARPRRVTAQGRLFRKEEEALQQLFGPSLGAGATSLFLAALERVGVAAFEEAALGSDRTARSYVADPVASERFLAQPRRERARRLAEAQALPGWLDRLFEAGDRLVTRAAIEGAALVTNDSSLYRQVPGEWLAFLTAGGFLEEHDGAFRLSPAQRGGEERAAPVSGRWHVQPNLEILVPPDAPLVDAFRLARVAEVASLDRAAVLRITPASLGRASEAGLEAAEVRAFLAARAAGAVSEAVLRTVDDGLRPRPIARAYEGEFAVLPPGIMARLRADPGFKELVQAEVAPGVVWLQIDGSDDLRRVLARLGVDVRFPSQPIRSTSWEQPSKVLHERLERELSRRVEAVPFDEVLASALAGARRGEDQHFAPPSPAAAQRTEASSGRPSTLQLPGVGVPRVPAPPRPTVEPPRALSPPRPTVEPPRALPPPRPASGSTRVPAPPTSSPVTFTVAWEPLAEAAIATRHDLLIHLADEARPRLVTPHRLSRHGGAPLLEALAHDSGDLRAYPAARVARAALAAPSDPDDLPAGAPVVALRAARNDKCPCGSNQKYKRCCLIADLAARA